MIRILTARQVFLFVIPAKAGIQVFRGQARFRFHRNDVILLFSSVYLSLSETFR
jgi:hypothetical protein